MLASLFRQALLPLDGGDPEPAAPSPPPGAPSVSPAAAVAPPSPAVVEYVRHARARRYLLRVRVDGSVRVTIPRRGSKRDAVRFVESHADWIAERLRDAARARTARRPPLPAEDVRALKQRAAETLPARLHALAERLGLTVHRVSIRNQRWRWGSCSRQAHICLNWRLVQMPDWVCDYVLIHELMHLRRMDHSPVFWRHVAAACPDYQKARTWLREHGQGLTED